MLRLRIAIPLLLSSSLTFPSAAQSAAECEGSSPMSPRCEAMHARAFAAARNAEIDASIAAVAAARARAMAAHAMPRSPRRAAMWPAGRRSP